MCIIPAEGNFLYVIFVFFHEIITFCFTDHTDWKNISPEFLYRPHNDTALKPKFKQKNLRIYIPRQIAGLRSI